MAKLVRTADASGTPTGWRYTDTDDSTELFDTSGRLLSITERQGRMQSLSYSDANTPRSIAQSAGLLIRVDDSFGGTLQFSYDAQNRLQTMLAPDAGTYSYSYGGHNNLQSVTYPDGRLRTYVYGELAFTQNVSRPNHLTGIVDESGVRFATFSYDNYGRAIATTHAGGADATSVTYTLNNNSNVTSANVMDAQGTIRVRQFQFLLGVSKNSGISQAGTSTTATYDMNGNVASKTDFDGHTTCYAYDLSRNLETVRIEGFAAGLNCPSNLSTYTPTAGTRQRKITTQWHATFRLPVQIDESGQRTTFSHDASGNVLTKTVLDTATNESRTWTYTYNNFGQVLTADGPRTDVSDVTTYTYYSCTTGSECGQVQTITNALGHLTTYNTYNAHGQPLTITDPNGLVTTLTYDLRQRLTSRTVGSEQTTFEYWPTGLLKKATLADSSFLEYTYDAAHRLTQVNDSEGNHIVYTLDAMGNRTAEQAYDPSNVLTQARTRVFNTLNQLWKQIGAAGTANVTTVFSYDNNGNQTGINAPLSRNTTQAYDELNRLKQVTDPLSGITQYGYNVLDQLTSVTDPKSLVTSYSYNALGDLRQQVSPDTGTTSNTYDSGGNLSTSTDARNAVTTYTYDALNRVTTAAFSVGTTTDQTLTYTYDAGTNGLGRLTGASDANHSLSWTYDPLGRVITKSQTVGTQIHSVSYGYTNGRLTSETTPSGQSIVYGYDAQGRITSISINGTTLLSNVLYEPFGPPRQWTWGNGTLTVRTHDLDGKVAQIDSAGLYVYNYDDAFRITGITDTANAANSWTYGYDLLDRLTSATKTGTTLGYAYDANGNRLTQAGTNTSTYTVDTASNRLNAVSGALGRTYTYDSAGNVTSDGSLTFFYNNRGRMRARTNGTNSVTYVYNALGQLVKRGGTTRVLMYDEAGHLLGEYNSTGGLVQETIWMDDIPVARIRVVSGALEVSYIHTDHLNTPRKLSRPSDNRLRWRWDPSPFGEGAPDETPEFSTPHIYNLRFPGQYFNQETELHYNYFRSFDPATGRYVESDPVGLKAGVNTYGYALQNPLWYIDPLGLDVQICSRPADLPFPLNLFDHYWVKTNRFEAGMGGPEGNVPAQGGRSDRPYDPTQTVDHSGQSKESNAQCQVMNNVDEDCVNSLIRPGQPTGRWHPFNQCQSFAWSAVNKCRKGPQIPPATTEPQQSPVDKTVNSLMPKVPR